MIKIRNELLHSNKIGEKRVITSSELAKFLGVSGNTDENYLLELVINNKMRGGIYGG